MYVTVFYIVNNTEATCSKQGGPPLEPSAAANCARRLARARSSAGCDNQSNLAMGGRVGHVSTLLISCFRDTKPLLSGVYVAYFHIRYNFGLIFQ